MSSPSGSQHHIQTYNHDGVHVSDLPDNQKPTPYADDTHKANDHRTGAEAVAPLAARSDSGSSAKPPMAGGPGGPGPVANGGAGRGPPKLDKFAYGFWDPQLAFFRKIVFKILLSGTMLTIIIMWLALPMYWGSLWLSNVYTNNLGVRIVDYDGGFIGSAVTQGLTQRTGQLGYFVSSASDWPNAQGLIDSILDEQEWAAITINSGASAQLTQARQNGLTSYNGSSAITVYYAQARNELAVNSYLNPYIQQALGAITAQLSAQSAAQ